MRRANANGIDIEYDCVGSDPAEPMPMPLGTRDALHLATALVWRDRMGPLPTMATHDPARIRLRPTEK
ncbi:MAG TPA: hypothetical protein VFS23_32110 [Vicinamibacterales bacterium]|nr:hypothetical protein [Vicinamibacterales bacterium]